VYVLQRDRKNERKWGGEEGGVVVVVQEASKATA